MHQNRYYRVADVVVVALVLMIQKQVWAGRARAVPPGVSLLPAVSATRARYDRTRYASMSKRRAPRPAAPPRSGARRPTSSAKSHPAAADADGGADAVAG